ncbi:MAG: hypothetical protein R3E13_03735 [Alphaproteobacteria bacterium]
MAKHNLKEDIFSKRNLRNKNRLLKAFQDAGYDARLTKKGHVVIKSEDGKVATIPTLHGGNNPKSAERLYKTFMQSAQQPKAANDSEYTTTKKPHKTATILPFKTPGND